MKPKVSVIIPAHNEEKYVKRCIRSIRQAGKCYEGEIEIIVVCNRCTDRTEQIAKKYGAVTIQNEERCIASVRNAGIKIATGQIILTIDCDNRMTAGTIQEVYELLKTEKYIGGGAPMRFERYSLPLYLNDWLCRIGFRVTGLYCGIFWAEKSTFEAVGGFVNQRAMEDIATAKQLKRFGKSQGKQYTCLKNNYLINSTRKFDDGGDWLYFKLMIQNADALIKAIWGDTSSYDKLIDRMFYDYQH